jgi:hypothetical protein
MAIRIALTLMMLAMSGPALAASDASDDGLALQWSSPATCPPGDLVGRVASLVGLGRKQLATKLLRVAAVVTARPQGDWRARLDVETVTGAGERSFEAEDCRSLLDGIALIVALSVDPTLGPTGEATRQPTPARPSEAAPNPAQAPPARALPRPRYAVRPLLAVEVGTLPEVALAYGLAAGVIWPRMRVELDTRWSSSQETTNAYGHGARIQSLLGSDGRACFHPMRLGWFEPAACAGVGAHWLRSSGLNITRPETRDSLAVAATAGLAFGLRLRDWLWLRGEGHFGLSLKRPRFQVDGNEEVYRPPLLNGLLAAGLELRL